MPLSLPNTLVNGTTADAVQVQANFNAVAAYANQTLVAKDGSVAMTGALTLPGDPVAGNHAATKAYVDNIAFGEGGASVPTGAIFPYAGSVAPNGYLVCDGSLVSRSTYASLFTAIGVTYGAGNGTTTFALPNLRGRFPIGLDPLQAANDTLGETGGSRDAVLVAHTHGGATGQNASLTVTGNPTLTGSTGTAGSHAHSYSRRELSGTLAYQSGSNLQSLTLQGATTPNAGDHNHTVSVSGTVSLTGGLHTHPITSEGVSGSGANLPPFITLFFIIKT